MEIQQFRDMVDDLLGTLLTPFVEKDEYALYEYGPRTVNRIGYATNMTPEAVRQAAGQKVDLILTHHDAWDFVYGMKEAWGCPKSRKIHFQGQLS